MSDLSANFESAGRAMLEFLHRRFGFSLWMITRFDGEDCIVLQAVDRAFGVAPGHVFRPPDPIGLELLRSSSPKITPNLDQPELQVSTADGELMPIRAFAGVPIHDKDGSLFGTLSAMDPAPQAETIRDEQELLELFAAMLSTILQSEWIAEEATRRSEKLQMELLTDAMTGLYNRRGWERLISAEEQRCRRFGHSAVILIVDLDDLKSINDAQGHPAGDALIKRAGEALKTVVRRSDVLARLGGDEFGILCIECDRAAGDAVLARVRAILDQTDVKASVGLAVRDPASDLSATWEAADHAMYTHKRSPSDG